EHDHGSVVLGDTQHRLLGAGQLAAPDLLRVRRAVHTVEDRTGAARCTREGTGIGDVDGTALHQRVLRAGPGPGQHAHLLTGPRELLGDGPSDWAGSGDDVEI